MKAAANHKVCVSFNAAVEAWRVGPRRPHRRGYILVFLMLSLVFLLGMVGLAIDIGRMYVAKGEAQSFVDSAALAAVTKLDGTSNGVSQAQNAATNDPKKWGFGLNSFSTVRTSFATSASGPWVTTPSPASNYYFAAVSTSVSLPMYFIRALAGPTAQIGATAIAGRQQVTTLVNGGEFPFSPYTRATSPSPDSATDPYGFATGMQYTLRWGAPGTRTTCGTDANNTLPSNGKIRGYCCVSGSAANLRQAIVGGLTDPETVGQAVNMDNGAKDTEMSAIASRVEEDSDTTSTTYAQYLSLGNGNGERVVVVPVNGGPPNYTNVGFAGFFLLNDSAYTGLGGNDSACAIYIGAWVKGMPAPQPGGSGAYHVKLYQ
jgi:Flp pilus assembly protein TadG